MSRPMRQFQQQREDRLRNRVSAVCRNIRDDDAPFFGSGNIHNIISGRKDADGWNRVQMQASTVTPAELALPAETLLGRLFPEENVRLFSPREASYYCPRDEAKVIDMLRSLGEAELASIIAEHGEIVAVLREVAEVGRERVAAAGLGGKKLVGQEAEIVADSEHAARRFRGRGGRGAREGRQHRVEQGQGKHNAGAAEKLTAGERPTRGDERTGVGGRGCFHSREEGAATCFGRGDFGRSRARGYAGRSAVGSHVGGWLRFRHGRRNACPRRSRTPLAAA